MVDDSATGSPDDQPLFSPSLISADDSSKLPEGYSIRPLRKSDYNNGFLRTLRDLTTVGDFSQDAFNARFDFLAQRNDSYYILVICDNTGTVVGTGTCLVERKFIHNLSMVGHIEDVVIAKDQQGKRLGISIVQALDHLAHRVGCYKIILACSETKEGFYTKSGFHRNGFEMAHYYI